MIDYVSDERAPTPTAAAERAVPVRADLIATVNDLGARQARGLWRRLEEAKTALRGAARGLPRLTDLLALPRQRFDMAAGRLGLALKASTQVARARLGETGARLTPQPLKLQLERFRAEIVKLSGRAQGALTRGIETKTVALATQAKLLSSLGYREVLSRGYALVLGTDGAPIRAAADTEPGLAVTLDFHDGRVGARIGDSEEAPPAKPKPAPKPRKSSGDDQGDLF